VQFVFTDLEINQAFLAVACREDKDIRALPSEQPVIATVANQPVLTFATVQPILATAIV
jgi:hypothetical protein